ncbi:MAG: hypothetical protein RLZ81_1771 [Pseudomonadota bacterium]|jgi:hypothetical protein
MKKTQLLFVSTIIAISANAFAADKDGHGHEHKPLHGGVVVEASDMDFELVAKADQISLHVRDHGKPTNLQGALAKLTLLNGSEKSEVQLVPVGDRLEAKGSYKLGTGTKAVATVTLAGKKPVNLRFALK